MARRDALVRAAAPEAQVSTAVDPDLLAVAREQFVARVRERAEDRHLGLVVVWA